MKRGVGYCENMNCDEYAKGVFALNQDVFYCPRCREKGHLEMERYVYENDFPVIREVRVQFDYSNVTNIYNHIAIATDDELGPHCNVLTVFSPLCKTDKRALRLAELYFAYVSLNGVGVKNIDSQENVINWDEPMDVVTRQCAQIGEKWDEAAIMRTKGLNYARR